MQEKKESGTCLANAIVAEARNRTKEANPRTLWHNDLVKTIMKLHRCADCPLRKRAADKPDGLLSRVHGRHKTWWPGWKIYLAELRAHSRATTAETPNVHAAEGGPR